MGRAVKLSEDDCKNIARTGEQGRDSALLQGNTAQVEWDKRIVIAKVLL